MPPLDAPSRQRRSSPDADHDERSAERGRVRCAACDHVVAFADDRTSVGDAGLHTFVNPAGEVFELVLFARAEGAAAVGRPTLEYTWFPGHAWTFARCRSCAAQLGWRYQGPTHFWGLITRAIVIEEPE